MMYTVEVTREDDAWIADVINLPGAHTYARNLTVLDDAVREVITLVADLAEDADLSVRYLYRNVDDTFLKATKLGEEREDLESKQKQLGLATAVTVANLAEAGYSVRDISGALRMSPGRVSQILGGQQEAARRAG